MSQRTTIGSLPGTGFVSASLETVFPKPAGTGMRSPRLMAAHSESIIPLAAAGAIPLK
jgi:hypothetical protein